MSHLLKQLGIGILALFLCGFASGRPAAEVICGEVLGGLDHQLEFAQDKLGSNRAPAALVSDAERRHWLDWSEKRLKEAQGAMDTLEEYPRYSQARKELSQIGMEWVTFHGYAQEGRVDSMRKTLNAIRAHGEKVRDMACAAKK